MGINRWYQRRKQFICKWLVARNGAAFQAQEFADILNAKFLAKNRRPVSRNKAIAILNELYGEGIVDKRRVTKTYEVWPADKRMHHTYQPVWEWSSLITAQDIMNEPETDPSDTTISPRQAQLGNGTVSISPFQSTSSCAVTLSSKERGQ